MKNRKIRILSVDCNLDERLIDPVADHILVSKIKKINDADKKVIMEAEVLIWNNQVEFDESTAKQFPSLKYIINWGTSRWNISESITKSSKYKIFYVDDYATEAVSDFALEVLTNEIGPLEKTLKNKSVGIVGLGKIGFRIYQKFQNYGVKKFFYTAQKDKKISNIEFCNQNDLLNKCDFVIVATKSRDLISVTNINNNNLVLVNLCTNDQFDFRQVQKALEENRLKSFFSDSIENGLVHPDAKFFGHVAYQTPQTITNKHNKLVYYMKRIYMAESDQSQKLFFVRHGETEWNREGVYQGQLDSRLTAKGYQQVEKAAKFLLGRSIDTVFTSPLGRAKSSAVVIAQALGLKPRTYGFLREQHFGELQGMPKNAAREEYAGFFEGRNVNRWVKLHEPYPGEGGESYYDVYNRIHDPFLELLAKTEGNAVFVGHESINRMLRGFARDLEPHEAVGDRQANDEVIVLDLATLTEEVVQLR